MLNLVQLQERLKNVPMQALMQYANGSNPQVPPFLALGELNRRKKMQEGAAAEQAKEMEGAPTIKQQIEQAAGLMALQGNRQQQAAQQQQGAQANMPMAAPNTTTSEPAQMASGGFIDDVVVPRDYQMGGRVGPQMTPEMLKKLMMLKAMKQRQGVAGIPVGNMFKRSDYAGGGIVAFAGPDGSYVDPVGPAPYETDDMETRRKREELRRKYALLASPLGMFTPVKAGQEKEFQENRSEIQNILNVLNRYNKEDLGSVEEALAQKMSKFRPGEKPSSSKMKSDAEQSAIEDARDRAMTDILSRQKIPTSKSVDTKKQSAPQAATSSANTGLSMLRKLQGVDVDTMFPTPTPFSEQAQFEKQKARKEMYGVSDQYLTDAERRLEERMGKQAARRAEQPMDQLISFLGGIAGGKRGGNWATQGAEGAMAAQKLSMAQQEANERQDEANDQLRLAIAEKRQALARGDMDAAAAAERDIKNATIEANKARLDFYKAGAQAEAQGLSAEAQLRAANRPSAGMEAFQLWQRDPKAYEAFKRAGGMGDENFMLKVQNAADKLLEKDLEYRTLQLSDKPEDRAKAAQRRQQAINQAMMDLQMISGGVTGGGGQQRLRYDAQGNPVQ